MILGVVGFIAVALTCTMFATKQMMLGFACVIFWAILGGYAYTISVYTWDPYYFIFFASFGMAIFCALAMYALRTKKEEEEEGDEFIDEGKDDIRYIDEGKEETEGEPKVSKQTKAVRGRADNRRLGKNRRPRL